MDHADLEEDEEIDEGVGESVGVIDYEKRFGSEIDNQLICHLVGFLWQKGPPQRATGGGSILVFLPGFHEIRQLGDELTTYFARNGLGDLREENEGRNPRNLFFIHGQIKPSKQREVFVIKSKKICLSTNVAETSLTIPDIDYVVDCGKQRMKLYEPGSQISMWKDVPISQSSAKQRAGRCGRIPGTVGQTFHLYSRSFHETHMEAEQIPELLRMPIHELCLSAKLLAVNNESIVRSAFIYFPFLSTYLIHFILGIYFFDI